MKKSLFAFALILTLVALTACGTQAAETQVVQVNTQPQTLIAEGQLLPQSFASVAFESSGRVEEVMAKDGDLVDAGDTLARLAESPALTTAIERARQEEIAARLSLDDYKSSADMHLVDAYKAVTDAENELDKAQARYDADKSTENELELNAANNALTLSQAAYDKLQENDGLDPDLLAAAESRDAAAKAALENAQNALVLTSPLSGTVAGVNLQVGQWVSAFNPVMSVADQSVWVVKTDNLTELEVVDVKVGQSVNVTLDALHDLALTGSVVSINPQFEEKRGDITYTVTIKLEQTDPQMRWGMTGAVEFLSE